MKKIITTACVMAIAINTLALKKIGLSVNSENKCLLVYNDSIQDNREKQTFIGAFKVNDGKTELKKITLSDSVDVVNRMASFPGGVEALMTYLVDNIQYPREAAEQGLSGCVVVQFVVEEDGSVNNVLIEKSIHPLLDNEAIRVVKKMPKWLPAIQNRKPHRLKLSLPITF